MAVLVLMLNLKWNGLNFLGLHNKQREKQALRREPDVGLDPWSPGSRPGPKAALNR